MRRTRPRKSRRLQEVEADHRTWLTTLFPNIFDGEFAPHHDWLWEWLWAMGPERPAPLVAIWPRGGAKSTSTEGAVTAAGALRKRNYALYVCDTQERADDHVSNIASMIESSQFGELYPEVAERAVSKYGTSKGWRRNRLRTQSGFTVDALGLDGDVRGIKLEDQRPDMLVLDDLDDSQDGPASVRSKITALTHDVLPALAANAAILAVQNWIHAEGIFARLADGTADFLKDRELSGPIKAVEDLVVEQDKSGRYIIKSGTPNWSGQGLEACQNFINTYGYKAFMAECQHEEHNPEGSLYSHVNFIHISEEAMPPVIRTTVWLDPAVTDTDHSDAQAIQADSLCTDWRIYRRRSWEQRSSPQYAMLMALRWSIELGATTLGVETDQGGDTWISVYREAISTARKEGWLKAGTRAPQFMAAKAGQGHGNKAHRQQQMLPEYENGRIVHVLGPTTAVLERALRRFPLRKPFDLADVNYWTWWALRRGIQRSSGGAAGGQNDVLASYLRGPQRAEITVY